MPENPIGALHPPPRTRAAAIAALAEVSLFRAALDDFERSAIDTARAGGASWAEIAAALGMASRQAAEQRRARLGGERQHNIDKLRQALETLATLLDGLPATGAVALAADTVALALEAPPGQQIDLARLVVDDLRGPAGKHPRIAAATRRIAALVAVDSAHVPHQT